MLQEVRRIYETMGLYTTALVFYFKCVFGAILLDVFFDEWGHIKHYFNKPFTSL